MDLTFAIAKINAWNRMGVAFRAEWKTKARPSAEIAPHAEPVEHEETAAE